MIGLNIFKNVSTSQKTKKENSFSEYVESSLPIIEELASEGALDYSVTLFMNGRIVKHLEEQNFWKDNQNGFREGRRTKDNIMIIKTLFEKYIKKNKQRLFMAFVDFRKFFDTINRKNLLYKMLKAGITGNLYKVIKSALSQQERIFNKV